MTPRIHLAYPFPPQSNITRYKGVSCVYGTNTSFYFNLGDGGDTDTGGWQDGATHTIKVAVFYYDTGTETIQLGWTNNGTTETTGTITTKLGGNVWKWCSFFPPSSAVKTATLFNSDFNNADFRIFSTGDLYLGGILVTDTTTNAIIAWYAQDLLPLTHDALTVPSVHVYHSAAQSTTTAVETPLNFDSERFDTDAMHYTSSANLTGTVTKSVGSNQIDGASTLFTTELSVGQVIDIPGTAVERFVVISIASATSLRVNANAANSAGGQTATRVNSMLVIRTPGKYLITAQIEFAANATGIRIIGIRLNPTSSGIGGTTIASTFSMPGTLTHSIQAITIYSLTNWDMLGVSAYQSSGGNLNVNSTGNFSPEFSAVRVA